MSLPLPELQMLLLDLISGRRDVTEGAVAQLDENDWDTVLGMADQHRLGPLLHWSLTHERAGLPVHRPVRDACARRFRESTLRGLAIQRELLIIHGLLDKAGIRHIALKGSYLALNAYPQPGLRPLRDLDILVAPDDALHAFQVLLDGGCTRAPGYEGDLATNLKLDKHLPPLISPSRQVPVELHFGLFPKDVDTAEGADAVSFPRLWARHESRSLGGAAIPYLAPTDMLLHLIVHAVYDHEFNNGPLLITDIAYLTESSVIDWSLFWHLAERGNHTRGCQLALRLAQRYWGTRSIRWPDGMEASATIEDAMDAAACLMLQDYETRRSVKASSDVMGDSRFGRVAALMRKAFPSRTRIAAHYAVSEQSALVYAFYPVKWWQLVTRRMPQILRLSRRSQYRGEVEQLCDLRRWLAQGQK